MTTNPRSSEPYTLFPPHPHRNTPPPKNIIQMNSRGRINLTRSTVLVAPFFFFFSPSARKRKKSALFPDVNMHED